MEKVKCDLCDSLNHKILFSQTDILHKTTTEPFQMVRCENCGLCFVNPRPTQNEIIKYYSNEYGFHRHQSQLKRSIINIFGSIVNYAFSGNHPLILRFLAKILITPLFYLPIPQKKLVHNLNPKIRSFIDIKRKGRLLDIGCGAGMHTHMYGYEEAIIALSKKGWDVYGIEPSEKARKLLSDNGLKNIYPEFHTAKLKDDYYDVVRMNWSLEHVHYPTSYLKECKRILKKGGKLIISIPNYNGITYKLFPQCVEIPIHLYYFSTDTFKKYCKKLDFKIVDYFTFSNLGLFLTCLDLMGHSNKERYSIKNHRETIKLKAFLDLMSDLDFGDDMVFHLTK